MSTTPLTEEAWEALVDQARAARARAYAPYSRFTVGAAIRCADGSVVAGCNVENASYGLTVCAERNAVGAMVVAGQRPVAVVIAGGDLTPVAPCGMCRQVLAEHGGPGLPVRSVSASGALASWTVGELLPGAFGPHDLAGP